MMIRIWLQNVGITFISYIISCKSCCIFCLKGMFNLLCLWVVLLLSSCQYVEPSDPLQEGVWVAEWCDLDERLEMWARFMLSQSVTSRDSYIISQKTFIIQRDFFLDENCAGSEKILENQVTYHIQKKIINDHGNIEIELLAEKSEIYSLGRADGLNKILFCGLDNWENFKKKDTNREDLINCYSLMSSPEGMIYTTESYIKDNIFYNVYYDNNKQRKLGRKFIFVRQ